MFEVVMCDWMACKKRNKTIKIQKKDFEEVMNLSLSWFEKKEEYEKCSEIFTWMGELKEKKQKNEMVKLI